MPCLTWIYAHLGAQNPLADSLKRELDEHPRADTIRVNILNQLAFEKHFNYPADALPYAFQARELAIKLNYSKGLALSYRYEGLAFWTHGNLNSAARALLEGKKIAEKENYIQILADITGNLGLVYNGLGEYQTALEYFQTSYNQQVKLNNVKRQIVMLNNIGDSYRMLQQYEKALEFYGLSKELGTPLDYLLETNNRNIGNVYESLDKLNDALTYYLESKKNSDRFNAVREKSLVRLSIARIYKRQGKLNDAHQLSLEALDIALRGNAKAPARDIYLFLSQLEEALHNQPKAFEYFKKYALYLDSVNQQSNKSKVDAIKLEYDLNAKQVEINYLNQLSSARDQELTLKNYLLLLSSGSILLTIGLLVYIIRQFRRQRDLNKTLHEQNKLIEVMNKSLSLNNLNLEDLVQQRTSLLEQQNQALLDYTHFNAHRLRAPVASIKGLIQILSIDQYKADTSLFNQSLEHLSTSINRLDEVIKEMNDKLNNTIDTRK